MKKPLLIAGIVGALSIGLNSSPGLNAQSALGGAATPVVVELFTSEGCSDCPAADTVLRTLERTQPVAGAQIIGLEEHVDYWNHLGWSDPFSSARFTSREDAYADRFHQDSVYTPEMVVNGRAQFVGSDIDQAKTQIASAARQGTASVVVTDAGDDTISLSVGRIAPDRTGSVKLFLAVTQDGLVSHVTGGENQGATLVHSSVVRSLTDLGSIGQGVDGKVVRTERLEISPKWNRAQLHAVVFLQDTTTGEILGAGVTALASPGPAGS